MRIGNIYEIQGQENEALNYYKKCVEIEPENHNIVLKITELQMK